MLCSDGWKKKAAGQGTPLLNVVILKPNGGVICWKAVNTAGEKNTGVAIKEMHLDMAKDSLEVTKNDLDKILGVVMDNPTTGPHVALDYC